MLDRIYVNFEVARDHGLSLAEVSGLFVIVGLIARNGRRTQTGAYISRADLMGASPLAFTSPRTTTRILSTLREKGLIDCGHNDGWISLTGAASNLSKEWLENVRED